MKPILVHIHIFYPEMWGELKECVKNITPHPFDMFVTMVEEHSEIQNDIKNNFPSAKIEIVENRGYDVGPFIHVINQINLDDYSYVVKLHTKRDMPQGTSLNYYNMSGKRWREHALSIIKDKEKFENCINAFTQNGNLGMIADYRLIVKKERDDKFSAYRAMELLHKLNLLSYKYKYVAGTVFIAQAHVFKILNNLNLTLNNFEQADNEHQKITFAHTIERLLGFIVIAQGYEISDINKHCKYDRGYFGCFWKLIRFIYQKKISRSGILTIKVLKLPIYRKRLSEREVK